MDYEAFKKTFKRYTETEFKSTDEHGYPADYWDELAYDQNTENPLVAVWVNPDGLYYMENDHDHEYNGRTWNKHWVIIGRCDFYGDDVFEGLAYWSETEYGIPVENRPEVHIW